MLLASDAVFSTVDLIYAGAVTLFHILMNLNFVVCFRDTVLIILTPSCILQKSSIVP
jgi:hypothetical protein